MDDNYEKDASTSLPKEPEPEVFYETFTLKKPPEAPSKEKKD